MFLSKYVDSFRTSPKWLIAFLGNPGKQYDGTRHNVGFMTADILQKRENISIKRYRFNALTASCAISGETALLLKPQTYMNLSGKAVFLAAAYYKIPPERVLVICDDAALPLGKIRIREKGSSGGHNGLKSIISALNTEDFPRIKIGVGPPPLNEQGDKMADWVLEKLRGKEAETISESCQTAVDAITALISDGTQKAMSRFN